MQELYLLSDLMETLRYATEPTHQQTNQVNRTLSEATASTSPLLHFTATIPIDYSRCNKCYFPETLPPELTNLISESIYKTRMETLNTLLSRCTRTMRDHTPFMRSVVCVACFGVVAGILTAWSVSCVSAFTACAVLSCLAGVGGVFWICSFLPRRCVRIVDAEVLRWTEEDRGVGVRWESVVSGGMFLSWNWRGVEREWVLKVVVCRGEGEGEEEWLPRYEEGFLVADGGGGDGHQMEQAPLYEVVAK